MIPITQAKEKDFRLLTNLGRTSFLESHSSSASSEDINSYVRLTYNNDVSKTELSDPNNIYHIIYHNGQPAGYSKIIFNSAPSNPQLQNATKLERLYLLKEFYGLRLGFDLFNFNVNLSKQNNQQGMWLFVWKENHRAVNFYTKAGFQIIGSYDFKISETHSNPNHQMLLTY